MEINLNKTITGQRIEIIGPAGIGKSTVYREVRKKWTPSSKWIHEGILSMPDNVSLLKPRKWITYKIKSLFKINSRINSGYGLRFMEQNQEMMSLIWRILDQYQGVYTNHYDVRLRTAYVYYKDFERVQRIKEKNDPRPCLMVEGLLQKSLLSEASPNSTEETIKEYIALCPMPTAVIQLYTDSPNQIIERIMGREKRNEAEIGLDEKGFLERINNYQKQFAIMESYLIRAGVKIHFVNASKTVSDSVKVITDILDGS